MNDIKLYGMKVSYTDELDLMQKVLNLYSKVINISSTENFLRPRHVSVLAFYLLKGYTNETKKLVLDSLEISVANLNQINAELTKKGFLIRGHSNYSEKFLSKGLESLKEYFMNREFNKLFMVSFKLDE